jgi:hypothetical protein
MMSMLVKVLHRNLCARGTPPPKAAAKNAGGLA